MPESKDAPPSAGGAGEPGLAELRRLLTGPAEVASVLPEAVRTARQRSLRDALQPLFEKAFQSSVRNHPQELADAISPLLRRAIRRSITEALRDFTDGLNQLLEKGASLRAVRWRIESRVTGRPFNEILLSKSLLYTVEQVFLIHRATGLLLAQAAIDGSSMLKDADMVSSMLLPLQDYVSDSFTEEHQQLETLDVGRHKLFIQYSPKALLVGAVSGSAPAALRTVFRNALDEIQTRLYAALDTFQGGDVAPFEAAQPYLQACLLGQSKVQKMRRRWFPWIIVAGVLILIAAWLVFSIRAQRRWDAYVAGLEGRPGLVILEAQKKRGEFVIRGFKDPDAPLPEPPPGNTVHFQLERYLSLDTPYARERDFQAARQHVDHGLIRFETGTAHLDPAQSGAIDDLASAMKTMLRIHPDWHIAVVGHTDEVGTEQANSSLSRERASSVADALALEGLPRDRLELQGVGNSQPLSLRATDWDRASNRRVSFQTRR
jgi:outer membrane protein OmpA-like peptidoglycan-associated protein